MCTLYSITQLPTPLHSLSLAPPLAPSWALHHKQFLLKGALCHHTRHTPHLWRQTRGEKQQMYPRKKLFRSHFASFLPFYIYSWKSPGSTIYIYKKGTTLLFSNCVPSLIYIYEAKYEPWGGIPIVSPHFVTLKDLFKGNVLYFCGNIVSQPRPNSVGT